jgi:putative NIF3 family GTP cyclohydrolase 1 type 2
MQIDPAVFSAVSSGLGAVGTGFTAWLAYRLRVKAMEHEIALARMHDCLDEHREEVKEAAKAIERLATNAHDLAANTLVMHGQNQAAIADNQKAIEKIAEELPEHDSHTAAPTAAGPSA